MPLSTAQDHLTLEIFYSPELPGSGENTAMGKVSLSYSELLELGSALSCPFAFCWERAMGGGGQKSP